MTYEVVWDGTRYRQDEIAYSLTEPYPFARVTMLCDAPGNGLPSEKEMAKVKPPKLAGDAWNPWGNGHHKPARVGRPKRTEPRVKVPRVKTGPHTHCACGYELTADMRRKGLKRCRACRKMNPSRPPGGWSAPTQGAA